MLRREILAKKSKGDAYENAKLPIPENF